MAATSGEFGSVLSGQNNSVENHENEEENDDNWDNAVAPKNSWLGKTARTLRNPALNCQLYLRGEFPDVFRVAQREYYGLK